MTDEDRMIAAWVTETGEKWFEGAGFTRKLWRSAWQAARATADHRDSVIEECAKICDRIAALIKTGSTATALETAEGCASDIRALKSQQDAAITAKEKT